MTSLRTKQIIEIAKQAAWHARYQVIVDYCVAGHARILTDNGAKYINLRVGTEVFSDVREDFPTEKLLADVALAIASGLSDNNYRDGNGVKA